MTAFFSQSGRNHYKYHVLAMRIVSVKVPVKVKMQTRETAGCEQHKQIKMSTRRDFIASGTESLRSSFSQFSVNPFATTELAVSFVTAEWNSEWIELHYRNPIYYYYVSIIISIDKRECNSGHYNSVSYILDLRTATIMTFCILAVINAFSLEVNYIRTDTVHPRCAS